MPASGFFADLNKIYKYKLNLADAINAKCMELPYPIIPHYSSFADYVQSILNIPSGVSGEGLTVVDFNSTMQDEYVDEVQIIRVRDIIYLDVSHLEDNLARAFGGITNIHFRPPRGVSLPLDNIIGFVVDKNGTMGQIIKYSFDSASLSYDLTVSTFLPTVLSFYLLDFHPESYGRYPGPFNNASFLNNYFGDYHYADNPDYRSIGQNAGFADFLLKEFTYVNFSRTLVSYMIQEPSSEYNGLLYYLKNVLNAFKNIIREKIQEKDPLALPTEKEQIFSYYETAIENMKPTDVVKHGDGLYFITTDDSAIRGQGTTERRLFIWPDTATIARLGINPRYRYLSLDNNDHYLMNAFGAHGKVVVNGQIDADMSVALGDYISDKYGNLSRIESIDKSLMETWTCRTATFLPTIMFFKYIPTEVENIVLNNGFLGYFGDIYRMPTNFVNEMTLADNLYNKMDDTLSALSYLSDLLGDDVPTDGDVPGEDDDQLAVS